MELYQFYIIYLIIISTITFLTYFIDKLKAISNAWRVPEKTLILLSVIGGAFGGLIATYALRHKTKRWHFTVINVTAILLHCFVTVVIATNF
ncbi:MAG: DUF1294 domain-containing protein [Clostridia bacterium]|nr:DUF1294 domain-containing protein [Clostridia bacterium]